jgi:hypothetical protein
MKIELKSLNVMLGRSDETYCYTASLYVNGKKIGDVGNSGMGGPDDFRGDMTKFQEADTWVSQNMPQMHLYDDHSIPMTIELLCGSIVEDSLLKKDLKKSLAKEVILEIPGTKGLQSMRWKGVRKITEAHILSAQKSYPKANILNTLPFDDALKIFKQQSA